MNKLFLISFLLVAIAFGSLAAVDFKCPEGFNLVAGMCFGPCAAGDLKQPTGWCKKGQSGPLYLPKITTGRV